MQGNPFAVVPTPPAVPPRVGLIPSVVGTPYDITAETDVVDGLEQRWSLGFAYNPENCRDGGVADPSACGSDVAVIGHNVPNVEEEPFLVYAGDRCSAFGFEARDYQGRATRLLLAQESRLIGHELWTGAKAIAAGWPNHYLASLEAEVISSGPTDPKTSLEALELALADCSGGARGMIHCTRELVTQWTTDGHQLRRDGTTILTINDTIVVPDAGYPGTGPHGQPRVNGSQWCYATSMVTVRRGQIVIVPGTYEEAVEASRFAGFRQTMDRGQNTIEFRAERLAAATWDHCCHFALEVSLPMVFVGS